MMLHFGRVLFGVWLIALHGVSADTVNATGMLEDTSCESRLEAMQKEVLKAQTKPLVLAEDPGAAHWPASRSAYVPPLLQYFQDFHVYLKTMNKQWAVAGVAAALGLLQVVTGPTSFKTVVILGFSLMSAASAQYEATLVWPQLNIPQQIFVSAAAALVAAFVVYNSLDGITTVVGFLFGLAISALVEPLFHTELWKLDQSIAWYSAWAVVGVLLFTQFQKYTLALLTPAVGGFLLSSSIGYFTMLAAWAAEQQPHNNLPQGLDIRGDCWIDFAVALLGQDYSVGIFHSVATPGLAVPSVEPDKVLGRVLWFLIFYLGMKRQWINAKRKNKVQSKYNGSLKDPLLHKV